MPVSHTVTQTQCCLNLGERILTKFFLLLAAVVATGTQNAIAVGSPGQSAVANAINTGQGVPPGAPINANANAVSTNAPAFASSISSGRKLKQVHTHAQMPKRHPTHTRHSPHSHSSTLTCAPHPASTPCTLTHPPPTPHTPPPYTPQWLYITQWVVRWGASPHTPCTHSTPPHRNTSAPHTLTHTHMPHMPHIPQPTPLPDCRLLSVRVRLGEGRVCALWALLV